MAATNKVYFTEHQRDIIKMICNEYSNTKIAEKLNLSKRTVESCREIIYKKMGVQNTAGLVVYAIKNGIYKIAK